jgi:hypothetical protein
MSDQNGSRRRPERYLPNEVCVVVDAAGAGSSDAPRLYEAVRQWLNRRIASLLAEPVGGPNTGGSFERDLTPTALRARYAGAGEVLRPLAPPNASIGPGRRPWVQLPRAGTSAVLHFLYHIGPATSSAAPNQEYVRDLVNVVNRRLLRGPDEIDATQSWYIVAATPHWLAAGAPNEWTDGGPGSRPAPAPAGDWQFVFADRALARLVDEATEESVVVAVLDTCPDRAQIKAAARRYRENDLLRWVDRSVRFSEDVGVVPPELTHLDQHAVNWRDGLARAQDDGDAVYRMPDHGLFSAGIIRQLAPKAEVHLIQALNDFGVGDLMALVDVLRQLPDRLLARRRKRRHLVVNLSLVADVPPSERLLELWLPQTCGDPPAMRRRQEDISRTLSAVHRSLAMAVDWLTGQGVLVVAAAGNDARAGAGRPEPSVPARYDEVLAVAAVRRGADGRPSETPSSFSNRGDVAVMGNGVAIFGGDARSSPDGPPVIETERAPVDAVAGVFSSPELPLGGGRNTSGWAYWSGTSFATPIASAIAANVWARRPSARPRQVIEGVRSFAVESRDPGDPNGPLDCPTVLVDQINRSAGAAGRNGH